MRIRIENLLNQGDYNLTIAHLDPTITIPTAADLNRPRTATDRTLGQAAFNWWD